jgi:chromosome segregation ATPase
MVLQQDVQEKLNKHREEKAKQEASQQTSEKKFSKEELDKISEIKSNYDAITLRMGQVHFELSSLNSEKLELENSFDNNREQEVEFAQQLTSKYGKGSLDISTGIFTPAE